MSFTIELENIQNQCTKCQKYEQSVKLTQFDPYKTAKDFCNLYYQEMTIKGCVGVLNLFDQNACCNYDGIEYIGFYNVMTAMATEGILKTAYDKLTCTVLPINSEQISLQVIGQIQGVTFLGNTTPTYIFTEVFIITLKDPSVCIVTSYSNKLIK